MRDIKFRVWDVKSKKMYPLAFPTWNGMLETREKDYTTPTFFLSQNGPEEQGILMQYTGLLDRNKKEIYEGDLVKNDRKGKERIWKVGWFESGFILFENNSVYADFNVWWEQTKIIGNIYENPELLK